MNGPGEAVLLVEDDQGDALLVQEMLADAAPQLTLTWERTLADAQRCLVRDEVSCVLLDLGLPDASGSQALSRLRDCGAPIVVLTGHGDEQSGIEALGAGAQDYLVKGSIDGPFLFRAIRYAIGRAQADAAARELLEARLIAAENARLERGLLPAALIDDPDLHVACTYRAGRRRALLGGDFYDVVELPDRSVLAVIGDVCGHGPDEAALGVCLRIAWRALILAGRPVPEVLSVLDRLTVSEGHVELSFATLALVRLAPDRRRADIYLAGHPAPVLLGHGSATVLEPSVRRAPLGLDLDGAWAATTVSLPAAWSLLLYTDGLIEGHVGRGTDRLGTEGLIGLLDGAPSSSADGEELLRGLVDEAQRLDGGELTDDLAAVLLSWP